MQVGKGAADCGTATVAISICRAKRPVVRRATAGHLTQSEQIGKERRHVMSINMKGNSMKTAIAALAGMVIFSDGVLARNALDKPITEIFYSHDSPKTVALCVADIEQGAQRELGDGSYLVAVEKKYGGSGANFLIKPDGNGSVIEYRKGRGRAGQPAWKAC